MRIKSNEGRKLTTCCALKIKNYLKVFLFLILAGLLNAFSYNAVSQTEVSGSVTYQSGEPIIGASVIVQGTAIGTVTGIEGDFALRIPNHAGVLVFSFVGMITQEIVIGGRSVFNIVLEEDIIGLEEVIAIGYGTARRADLTSSVSTVTSEDFNAGNISSPVQLLQGRVPGLNISSDGNPYGSTSIILRGPSTLRGGGAQQPLFVVDGVVGASLGAIPPDDIVSVDVLRDASAAAIYGSRAANGVILITTKKGEAGMTRLSYNTYLGVETISRKWEMMDEDEYRGYIAQHGYTLSSTIDAGSWVDWQDELAQQSVSQRHNLTMSGGADNTTYMAGINYLQNNGLIQGTGLERFTLRARVDQKALNNRLNVGVNINSTVTDSQHVPGLVWDHMLTRLRTMPIYNEDGSFFEHYAWGTRNPLSLIESNWDDRRNKLFLGTMYGELNLFDGLDINVNASYQNNTSERGVYQAIDSGVDLSVDGYAFRSSWESENKLLESFATYNNSFDRHVFTLLAGYSWQEQTSGKGFQNTNINFPSDVTLYNNLGLGQPPSGYLPDYGNSVVSTLRMISLYSRLNYNYDNRYIFQATIRRDGSSAFGANERWGWFPSASFAWRISEESFMEDVNIADLKLRASWGISGNSLGFDPLISKIRYTAGTNFLFDGRYLTSIQPSQNANPDIRWEETSMTNIGLDLAVLRGRLSGTVEYYNKTTDGLIWSYPVSTAEYFVGWLTANVGEISNKGWEFTINAVPVHTRDFYWKSSMNFSTNENLVVSLSDDQFTLERIEVGGSYGSGQSGNQHQVVQEGYPVGQFYMFKYAGLSSDGVSQFYDTEGNITTAPSASDKHYFGSPQPKAFFGLSSNMTYRNIDMSLFFRGVTGNYILNATRAELNRVSQPTMYHLMKEALKNDPSDHQAHFISDRYLEKGGYLRLDNLTIGYTLNGFMAGTFDKLRIYATVNNVLTITGYKGLDPEVDIAGITPGVDAFNYYPKTRTFMFGVNFDF